MRQICLATNHCSGDTPVALRAQLLPFVPLLLPLLPPPQPTPPPPKTTTPPPTASTAEGVAAAAALASAVSLSQPSPLHMSAALCLVELSSHEACVEALFAAGALPTMLAQLDAPPSQLRDAAAAVRALTHAHIIHAQNPAPHSRHLARPVLYTYPGVPMRMCPRARGVSVGRCSALAARTRRGGARWLCAAVCASSAATCSNRSGTPAWGSSSLQP